ncbi:MAG: hypothetical protein NT018_00200, partial [Armatimonadetes bacterium]|nr:hypothetical protein [Armatimonadota bacterium]
MRAKISAIAASTWQVCIITVALIVISTCSAIAGKAITRIDVTNKSDRTVITVQGNESLKMMPFSSSAGRYLGFQFSAVLAAKSRVVGVHNGAIFCVKYSNFRSSPPCSRIVVNTSARLEYSTQWSVDKKRLEISIWKKGSNPALASAGNLSTIVPASEPNDVTLTVLPPLSGVIPDSSIDAPAASAEPVVKPKDITAPPVRLSEESRKVYAALRSVGTTAKAAHQMAAATPQITSRQPNDVKLTVLPPLSSVIPTGSIDAPAASVEPAVKAKDITARPVRLSEESR